MKLKEFVDCYKGNGFCGCFVGDDPLLDSATDLLYDYIELHEVEFEILQIKEKFGTLRFYYHLGEDTDLRDAGYIDGIVDLLERLWE